MAAEGCDGVTAKPSPKYWIRKTFEECPICGRGGEYRERMPLPKPVNWEERYIFNVAYDWCDAL